MSKKNKYREKYNNNAEEQIEEPKTVQDQPIVFPYSSFDEFFYDIVRNGERKHLEACRLHIKALGCSDKPERWLECLRHFGIKNEQ